MDIDMELLDRRAREVLDAYNANPEPGLSVARFAYASRKKRLEDSYMRRYGLGSVVRHEDRSRSRDYPYTWVLVGIALSKWAIEDYELEEYAKGYYKEHITPRIEVDD